jgi:hypothetical protein
MQIAMEEVITLIEWRIKIAIEEVITQSSQSGG